MASEENDYENYRDPLVERYASARMSRRFSPANKFRTWRRLWVALAEAQARLGIPISEEQLAQMRKVQDDIDYQGAEEWERKVRHDVMSHVLTFGDQAPLAKPIIHLGATSCFVTDNTELIQMRDGLKLVIRKLVNVIDKLASFAEQHKDLPVVGYTHFQPAQLTTLGKRACLWLQDLVMDLEELQCKLESLRFRGAKGATGTQASFLELFAGDAEKVRRLEQGIARKFGFSHCYPVTGQTYSRKVDAQVISALAGIGISAHRFANDLRLLQHKRELFEPFGSAQVGSSAMPYKRNPILAERLTALARYLIALIQNPVMTAAEQWLERTLDDSANRRIVIPEAFLTADAILTIYLRLAGALEVNQETIRRNVEEHFPLVASEAVLMRAVKEGGDRQELHEALRKLSHQALEEAERAGQPPDLLSKLKCDPQFASAAREVALDPVKLTGLAPQQVDAFLKEYVAPIRTRYRDLLGMEGKVEV